MGGAVERREQWNHGIGDELFARSLAPISHDCIRIPIPRARDAKATAAGPLPDLGV